MARPADLRSRAVASDGTTYALRSDDRRKVANAESRTAAFSGGFFAQREAQESAREDSRMSAGRARNVDQQWARPR